MHVYMYIHAYTASTDGIGTPDPNPKHLVSLCL